MRATAQTNLISSSRPTELANKSTQQLYKVATPCMDFHQFNKEENESGGELSTVCSQIVLKCLYLARVGRPEILWSVNKLARAEKQNLNPVWKVLNKEVDLGEPTSFLDHVYLGCSQRQCALCKDIVDN